MHRRAEPECRERPVEHVVRGALVRHEHSGLVGLKRLESGDLAGEQRCRHEVVVPMLHSVVDELRGAGPRATRAAKRLVLDRPDGQETARRIAERRTSEEGQEGLRAFLERRAPEWAVEDAG